MKRKFYDGKRVRVIGADWTFRVVGCMFDFEKISFSATERTKTGFRWWPEYLLESAK